MDLRYSTKALLHWPIELRSGRLLPLPRGAAPPLPRRCPPAVMARGGAARVEAAAGACSRAERRSGRRVARGRAHTRRTDGSKVRGGRAGGGYRRAAGRGSRPTRQRGAPSGSARCGQARRRRESHFISQGLTRCSNSRRRTGSAAQRSTGGQKQGLRARTRRRMRRGVARAAADGSPTPRTDCAQVTIEIMEKEGGQKASEMLNCPISMVPRTRHESVGVTQQDGTSCSVNGEACGFLKDVAGGHESRTRRGRCDAMRGETRRGEAAPPVLQRSILRCKENCR